MSPPVHYWIRLQGITVLSLSLWKTMSCLSVLMQEMSLMSLSQLECTCKYAIYWGDAIVCEDFRGSSIVFICLGKMVTRIFKMKNGYRKKIQRGYQKYKMLGQKWRYLFCHFSDSSIYMKYRALELMVLKKISVLYHKWGTVFILFTILYALVRFLGIDATRRLKLSWHLSKPPTE